MNHLADCLLPSVAIPEAHVHPAVVWVSHLLEGQVVNVEMWHICATWVGAVAHSCLTFAGVGHLYDGLTSLLQCRSRADISATCLFLAQACNWQHLRQLFFE